MPGFDPFAPDPDADHYPDVVLCPQCRADVPAGPRWVSWCEGCGWNALAGAPQPPGHRSPWATRWSERLRATAARRVHQELVTGAGRPSPWPRRAAVALAVLVLAVTAAEVVLDGVWAATGSGFWHWPGVVLLAALLAAVLQGLVPRRRGRDEPEGRESLSEQEAPQLHALVRDVALVVGVAPPARIHLSTDDNAWVDTGLYSRDADLTLGLLLWGRLPWDARLALLGHELGHLLPAGGGHRAVRMARTVLRGWVEVLWPSGYEVARERRRALWRGGRSVMAGGPVLAWAVTVVQRVAAVPALLTLVLLDRLEAAAAQRREYAADVASARVAGTEGAVRLLASVVDRRGWRTTVTAAARRDEDVWAALAAAGRRPERETARLRRIAATETVRTDASHPPTALRLALIEHLLPLGPAAQLTPQRLAAVDAETTRLVAARRRALGDRLLETWV